MIILFILSVFVLVQAYIGYPVSLWLIGRMRRRRDAHRIDADLPTVTVVISAYNEERVIRGKLENSLALDYPGDRIARVVVSDGSTDRTEEIVREFEGRGVRLAALAGRRGKVACLNAVIPEVTSDIVVMSDANSMYAKDSVRQLVRHFADPGVGCVCGRLVYANPERLAAGEGERLYWGYEERIKRLESSLGSLLGANGAMYAYRREHFDPVDPLMFCDDVIPTRIALRGLLVLFEPLAVCTEESVSERVERHRRRRHASFGLRSMLMLARGAIIERRWLLLYQIISHRILRWMGGPALLGLLISTPFLPPLLKLSMVGAQGLLYLGALAGFLVSRLGCHPPLLYLPYYYLVMTVAGVRGLAAWLLANDRPHWEPRN